MLALSQSGEMAEKILKKLAPLMQKGLSEDQLKEEAKAVHKYFNMGANKLFSVEWLMQMHEKEKEDLLEELMDLLKKQTEINIQRIHELFQKMPDVVSFVDLAYQQTLDTIHDIGTKVGILQTGLQAALQVAKSPQQPAQIAPVPPTQQQPAQIAAAAAAKQPLQMAIQALVTSGLFVMDIGVGGVLRGMNLLKPSIIGEEHAATYEKHVKNISGTTGVLFDYMRDGGKTPSFIDDVEKISKHLTAYEAFMLSIAEPEQTYSTPFDSMRKGPAPRGGR